MFILSILLIFQSLPWLKEPSELNGSAVSFLKFKQQDADSGV